MKFLSKNAWVAGIVSVALALPAYAVADASQAERVARKVAELTRKLGADAAALSQAGWADTPEVQELKSYPAMKRMAATRFLIHFIKESENRLFPNYQADEHQLAAVLASRYHAYTLLQALVSDTIDEVGIKSFLDSEIADLRLTLSHMIPYGMYLTSRAQRDDKIAYLYMTSEAYSRLSNKLFTEKGRSISGLASKTVSIALAKTCASNHDLCERL